MDTFELLPSLAQGELPETSAPELVAAVFRARSTGTLSLETKNGEVRAYFRAGDMCGTGAFAGFKTLAHVLLENELVDALDIDASGTEAQATRRRHGEVLVSKGLLTPEQLRNALATQHRANLLNVLLLEEGRYEWRGWEPPPQWAREVGVDPVGVIVDALEQDRFLEQRRRVIGWLGRHRARLSVDWPELQARVALAPMDRRAAALFALPRTLTEFVQASRLPQDRAEALLVALLLAGGVEPQPGATAATTEPELAAEEDAPLAHREEEDLSEPSFAEVEPLPEPELEPEPPSKGSVGRRPRRAMLDEQDAIARLDSLSLDDDQGQQHSEDEPLELDSDPRAVAPGAVSAPQHDDMSFDEPVAAASRPEARGMDEDRARELRKKMLQRGMRNLGVMPAGGPREAAGTATAEEPAAPGELDLDSLGDEERRFVVDVRNRVRMLDSQHAYARLGVTPTAAADAIKQAYLQAVKRYHPDRAGAPGLAGLQPDLQKLFTAVRDAWETLSTPESRAQYDAQLKGGTSAGSGSASRREEASVALKMGDVLLKKRDFEAALAKLRRAVELDPTGDSMAALAWGLVSDPKATAETKEEAASLINRALRASGATARTYYVAGVLWRTKDPDSAVDAFRKALELDPRHPDAALELRLIEQRRNKPAKGGGGVLSGLLFGKRKPSP